MRKINFQSPALRFKICRYIVPVFICQFLFLNLYAQNRHLDSLDQLIAKAKTDTDRINLNIQKINILVRSNLDTSIYLSKQLLKEAEKANFYTGIFELHTQLANNYSFKGSFDSAKENIQILEKIVKPSDSLKIATIYSVYGMMYGVQGNYDSSIKFYEKAIGVNERLNSIKDLTTNYANVAIGYQQLANFPKALDYQQRSLRLAESQKNEEMQANTLLNMGITYEEIGDTLKAERTYLKATDIAVKNGYKIIELYLYTNLSTLYIGSSRWSEAYEYAMKAAALGDTTGDLGIKAASLAKAAISLANQNKFDEATVLSKQSVKMADSSQQPLNISQAYEALGTTLYLQKKYKEAIPYFEKSLGVLNGASNYDHSYVETYISLSECYEKTGNYVKALANYKIAAELEDSIKRKDNVRKATELSMNYDFEKKQEILAAEKKRDDELAKTKQLVLIIGLLLVLILAVVALKGYRNKQRANNLLREQKKQIEGTLSELKATQKQLVQSEKMASLGELTAGIAHEIQNPLNFVNNFSEVNKELLAEMNEEIEKGNMNEVKSIAKNITENEGKIIHHGKRADSIVKGMLQHSRSSTGKKEPTNINALADEYLRLSYHGLRAKDKGFDATIPITIGTDFDESIGKINIIPQDIGRVMLNLYNNAFYAVTEKKKSAEAGYEPTVSVSTKKINGKIEIRVKDNGNGIPQKVVDKIFQPFFTTKPTGVGTGLGLSLSYDIIKAHGGEIKVETLSAEAAAQAGKENEGLPGEQTGTEFIIQLPTN
jgi:signal transduction histidine kinase